MEKTNTAQLEVTGAYGSLQYAWAQVPEEFVPMRLQGASIFTKFEDGDVDPTDLFGGNAQQSGLAGDVMYAAFAMDELGCMSGEGFSFEKPKPAAIAPPVWGLFGNDANGALIPPSGGGGAAWLGTNDSTDFVMKVNGEPQLKLGADGVTEFIGNVKMSGIGDLVPDTTLPEPKILVLSGDGTVVASSAHGGDLFQAWQDYSLQFPCEADPSGEYVEYWKYQPNRTYIQCPQVNVGIGTNNPLAKLDVRGQTYSRTLSVNTYDQNARVTIKGGYPGLQNQAKALEVQDNNGNAAFQVLNDGKTIVGAGGFSSNTDGARLYLGDENHYIKSVYNKGLSLSTYGAEDALVIEEGSGNVGIGVGPDHSFGDGMLEVDGTIRARRVVAEQTGWPDYVFEDGYEQMSLADLRNFIHENKRLPGIPSANEIETDGLDLGELIKLQMKKIEELTLYVLELEERLNEKSGK